MIPSDSSSSRVQDRSHHILYKYEIGPWEYPMQSHGPNGAVWSENLALYRISSANPTTLSKSPALLVARGPLWRVWGPENNHGVVRVHTVSHPKHLSSAQEDVGCVPSPKVTGE